MRLPEAIAWAIERLGRVAADSSPEPAIRTAASRAPGLPVHHDMGGILVLRSDGSVAHYDPETDRMREVHDDEPGRWRTFALIQASKQFPELGALHPPRPDDAIVCSECAGSGTRYESFICGACLGTGWLARSQE